MSIAKHAVEKCGIGKLGQIVASSSLPEELAGFRLVVEELEEMEEAGVIEIVEKAAEQVKFKRLR